MRDRHLKFHEDRDNLFGEPPYARRNLVDSHATCQTSSSSR
jgi:hypothetical protein